jgi:hypothetical protein
VTFDGGSHWHSLRLNMPASAIYDIEIQDAANDLVVASHGRGVWILDDLLPIQQWADAQASSVTLFAPRDAFRMWRWAPVNTFTNPTIPPNEFVGANPPYGAIVTYYLAHPAKHASIEIVDAGGHVVRHLDGNDVPGHTGLNRAAWDLAEDGPVKWYGTYKLNQGPDEGAEVVPGNFTVRLTVDGVTKEQPLAVRGDPRDPGAAYQARHDFLAEVFSELNGVDAMLNAIDTRLKTASPSQRAALLAFRSKLTYDPRNIEDLSGPAQLREDLLDMVGRLGTSFEAPTATQLEVGAEYKARYAEVSAAYRQLSSAP